MPGGSNRIDAVAGDSANYFELYQAFRDVDAEPGDPDWSVLSGLMSVILNDEGDGQRFTPMAVWADGSSTFHPNSLTDDQIAWLADLTPMNPAARARIADAVWERARGETRVTVADRAVSAYVELSADQEGWQAIDNLKRAYDIAVRFARGDESARVDRIVGLVRDRFVRGDGVRVVDRLRGARFLREAGISSEDRPSVVMLLEQCVEELADAEDHRLARKAIEELILWTPDDGARADLTSQIADLWEAEADSRLEGEQRSAMVSASFVEEALQTLRGIPRKHRERLNVSERLDRLRLRLGQLNEEAMDEMQSFETDPISLAEPIAQVQARLTGKDMPEALVVLARLERLSAEERERATAAEALQGTIARLFGHTTFTSDGRVADKSGEEEAIERQMGQAFQLRISLVSMGVVLPGLRVLRAEHSLTLDQFYELCKASSIIPAGRELLFATALFAGWNFDFATAVHLLVPQMEALVRYHLKGAGVFTTHITKDGIEDEVSLTTLLEKEEAERVLGAQLTYELRSIFTGRFGANLRHDVAHGLVDDRIARSAQAVYVWWLVLRLVTTPFWNQMVAADDDGPESNNTKR